MRQNPIPIGELQDGGVGVAIAGGVDMYVFVSWWVGVGMPMYPYKYELKQQHNVQIIASNMCEGKFNARIMARML